MTRFSRIAFAAFLLAGCSDAGSISAPPTDDSAPSELAFADAEAVPGEALTLALIKPASLIPSEISLADQSAVIAADLYYDGLVEADGSSLRPALASSWTANDDFTVWTFAIDPARATADEVASSLRSVVADSNAGQVSLLLSHVSSIDVAGDDVVISLSQSDAGLAWLLSGVRYSIVGANGAETGQYDVTETDDTTVFALDNGRGVTVSWVADHQASYGALTADVVDGAVVGKADLATANAAEGLPASFRSISRFYVANIASPVMRQSDIRDAVLGAIDREALVRLEPAGSYLSDGVVPNTVAGYDGDHCGTACVRNPALASGLLAEGVQLPAIRVAYSTDTQAAAAQSIVSDLVLVGFTAEAVQYDEAGLAAAISDGTVDLYSFGFVAEAGSVGAVIRSLHSESVLNAARLADPAIDGLIDQAAVTADDAERWDLLNEAQQLALTYSIFVPVTAAHSELVWSDSAGDLVVRADGSIDTQSIK